MFSLQILALLFCLLACAFFAGLETGLIAMNRLRLQHLVRRQVPGASIIRYFLNHSNLLLGTTLTGCNLSSVCAAMLCASIGHQLYGAVGALIAGAVLTVVLLVFCEYVPKAWFQASPATRVLPFARLLRFSAYALYPFIVMTNWIIRTVLRVPAAEPDSAKILVSREELQYLTNEGIQSGVLSQREIDMIHGVFTLTQKTCASIMVPRDQMIVVPATAGVDELIALARAYDVNRFPVYDKEKRIYAGVVHIFDVLSDEAAAGKTVLQYVRPAQMIASYLPVDHLLPRMRVTKSPMFLVTDERFEVVGLVTLEDVLEEIVG